MVNPIREDCPQIIPHLVVDDANAAIRFYRSVFDATVEKHVSTPQNKISHAELRIGNSVIMLADEFPQDNVTPSPRTIGGTPVTLYIYVKEVDNVFNQAVQAGAKVRRPIEDRYYGDRSCQLEDPFGHSWIIATRVEDVPPDEMARRIAKIPARD